MATAEPALTIFERLDKLNEFEREPITADKLHGGAYFAAVFSGEHIAATEFVIGALFVSFGARAYDVVVGLLLGNLLAVLSWTLVCAPIAVQTRLTLYWYLRRIAGPAVTCLYNVLNAVLYCVLAGAMITVSASAIRIPLGIESQTKWYPDDVRFVLLVLGVGAVVVTIAILGFKKLAEFSSVCSPWMVVMFLVGGLVALPTLGPANSLKNVWHIAEHQVWVGPSEPGQTKAAPDFSAGAAPAGRTAEQGLKASGPAAQSPQPGLGFWHVVAFAWICNLAMHLGLSDMALFRYAKRGWYGVYSAFGMYLGHYVSWICAGIMGAAAANALRQPLCGIDSGSIAYEVMGIVGALTVVIAGWTTANPTLYRAGLALQVVTPGWPRWLITLAVGALTTVIACFPFVFTKMLDFVAIYGIMLVPVGVIVVLEHWVFPRIGFKQYWSLRKGQTVNRPALFSWFIALLFAAVCWGTKIVTGMMANEGPLAGWLTSLHQVLPCVPATLDAPVEIIHEFFLVIPVWILTAVFYLVLAAMSGARHSLPALPEETPPVAVPASPAATAATPGGSRIEYAAGALALVCLVLSLGFAICVFLGYLARTEFKSHLAYLTLIYFVSATAWMWLRERRKLAAG